MIEDILLEFVFAWNEGVLRVLGYEETIYVPLIEGKLIWQHNAVHATFEGVDAAGIRRGRAMPLPEHHAGRRPFVEPRFWVSL